MGEAPMDEKLVAACQMFLVPATILFAALAVATREALKTPALHYRSGNQHSLAVPTLSVDRVI
jgi:hypothetical protein